MKYVMYLVMPVLLAACGRPTVYTSDHAAMARILKSRAVALVEKNIAGQVESYCSGVWIGQNKILTAAHCVDGVDYVNYVVDSDVFALGDLAPRMNIPVRLADVTKRDKDHDLALLTISGITPPHDWAPIFPGEIVQGQGVQCLGNPLGLWFSYSHGEVAAVRIQDSEAGFPMLFVQSEVAISAGSSGGALFDEDGNVLGITHGSYT